MKSIQRTFIPGSEWLFIKLYTGCKTADKILINQISPIIKKLEKNGIIEKWFFIRYYDPDFHLRIRFLTKDKKNVGEVISILNNQISKLIPDSIIWKVQIDTYNRELERYKFNLIELTESIFHLDSICILSLIKKLAINENENFRWMIALKLVDQLLSDFHFDLSQKQDIMNNSNQAFKSEFGFNKFNSKQFNTEYRKHKATIDLILKDTITNMHFVSLYLPINLRSRKIKLLIKRSNIINTKTTLSTLLPSYIHMTLNRLFRTKSRIHELLIYDFLYRYYTSELARERYNKSSN